MKPYMDDPGMTADELLRLLELETVRVGMKYWTGNTANHYFWVVPVSFTELLEEAGKSAPEVGINTIYGLPVQIVSDWDSAGIELLYRYSGRGRSLESLYHFPDK